MTAPLTVGFDLDLTLVDSHDRIINAYIRALADLGVEVSGEDLVPHRGLPLTHTVAAVAPAVDADALVLRYRHQGYSTDRTWVPQQPGHPNPHVLVGAYHHSILWLVRSAE